MRAEIKFESELDNISHFNWELISSIHKTAFNHLYEFAGELRQINLSKGGFMFPAVKFLPSVVEEFEIEFLNALPDSFEEYEQLINHVAPLHAELLFIHPFRDGNGRTAWFFVDLIALKSGFDHFNFEKITEERMPEYIESVQAAADKNYEPMTRLFRSLKK
ncbi:Fic/DOC family protein [Rhodohalobacter halophilus]|uniref:Fic/DOC family protein n=1 Tax=Rhodohalobacter halophilus TaxID=1812810 RepID=UPI00159F0F5A|nr:Fic family protein [Rhodohalobacter halophilus]